MLYNYLAVMGKMKVILILPAYNAAKTLPAFLKNLPTGIFDHIILVDDCSRDRTLEAAKRLAAKQKNMSVFTTLRNLGYGGNLKMSLSLALGMGADVIIELHPDSEYGSDGIVPALEAVKKGARLVLGNRFADGYPQGMYWWKYFFTRFLSSVQNIFLGTAIPDLHQGFRVYTREILEKVDYRANANNYLFSFEIICQAIFNNLQIASVPVSARYTGKKRGASLRNSIIYTLQTFLVLSSFLFAKAGAAQRLFFPPTKLPPCPTCQLPYFVKRRELQGRYQVLFCDQCRIGFTNPQPKDLSKFYPRDYWQRNSFLGKLKAVIFKIAQKRRVDWILEKMQKGDVLDVGSGEGIFGESLPDSFSVVSLETPSATMKNAKVLKKDFLSWKTSKKFDAITFWESLEHVPTAKQYLEKAYALLKPGGYLFVEYPRCQGLESKIFGSHWFHLDMPRHTYHFTDLGIRFLMQRSGYKDVSSQQVLAWEYAPWGIAASVLSLFSFHEEGRWGKGLVIFFVVLPILPLAVLLSLFLYFCGQSSIMLIVARKTT